MQFFKIRIWTELKHIQQCVNLDFMLTIQLKKNHCVFACVFMYVCANECIIMYVCACVLSCAGSVCNRGWFRLGRVEHPALLLTRGFRLIEAPLMPRHRFEGIINTFWLLWSSCHRKYNLHQTMKQTAFLPSFFISYLLSAQPGPLKAIH